MAASSAHRAGLKVYVPALFLALVATLLLTSCAGAGSSGSSNTSSNSSAATSSVTGTAASGNPIASATVTLEDSTGKSATATTGADGTFSVNTTGMTPPFFVKVQPANSTLPALYSVSADANASTNINIHPLTDLIVRSWYAAQGLTADAAFSNPTGPNAPPTPLQVKIIANVVLQVLQLWLTNNGIDVTKFDLIATPFQANGTGLDKVLDETKINISNGQITVTDGTTTQTSTASYSSGTVTITTTTTNSSGSTSTTVSTVIPNSTQQTVLSAIQTQMNALANVINTKASALQDTDFLPYIAADLLDGGLNQAQFAAQAAGSFRGMTVSFTVLRVVSVDTTNGVADVVFSMTRSLNGLSQTQTNEFFFKDEGGTWYLAGDQRIAKVSLQAEMSTNQGALTTGSGPNINLDVQSPQGTIGVPTVSGGGIWSSTALQQGATIVDTFNPTPTTTLTVNLDHYFQNSGPLPTLVPAGTNFTLAVTPTSGSPVSYTLPSNAFTTEGISFTGLTNSAISSLTFNAPVTFNWTLPTTFAAATVKLTAETFTGPQSNPSSYNCNVKNAVLSSTSTSGTITIPSTCNGQPVVQVNINVMVDGPDGERTMAIFFYQ